MGALLESALGRYKVMLKSRLIEEYMLMALRKGQISKWFAGIGQEAISVGAAAALRDSDFLFTVHRNLGVFVAREIPLDKLFCQFLGKAEGFTKGRDRTYHFGAPEYKIIGMISHLAAQLCVANGVALAQTLRKTSGVALAFTGEGGTSEGDFHEALNIASTWKLPVIFIIENNGYALSTPVKEQYACSDLADRAKAYGCPGEVVDGNDVQAVYESVLKHANRVREQPGPVLIECKTFRMRGHEEASGVAYVPAHLFKEWEERDPLKQALDQLAESWSASDNELFIKQQKEEIAQAFEYALQAPEVHVSVQAELSDVYEPAEEYSASIYSSSDKKNDFRFIDAVKDGLRESLLALPELVVMGQDIAEYGGVFKVTQGFLEEFGSNRIRNTPLCESGVLGAALGLAIEGIPSVVEMQFADFVSCGFNQIVNNLAKTRYRWGHKVPVTIRLPSGGGVGAGPFHSQSNEAWFMHVPGLKVVCPSNAYDAKGLLIASIADPNPVLFFEHKALYRSQVSATPEGRYVVPLGKAKVVSEGDRLTVITYGLGVSWVQGVMEQNPKYDIELIDLRTLLPLDSDTLIKSVKKTGRVLVVTEPPGFCGPGAEVAAMLGEECFAYLDAPVRRLGSLFTPVPFLKDLEGQYLPRERLAQAIKDLYEF